MLDDIKAIMKTTRIAWQKSKEINNEETIKWAWQETCIINKKQKEAFEKINNRKWNSLRHKSNTI